MKRFRPMRLVHRHFNERPRFRRWLTGLAYGRRDRDIVLFGRIIRANASLESGYCRAARLAKTSSTLASETALLLRLALFYREGATLVDIGANIGLFSICAADARVIYPTFRVIAFEPDPGTFARLQVNAERFGFEAVQCALASDEREVRFVGGAVSGVTTLVDKANAYNIADTGFTARTRRLDSFDLPGDLILKIDVEGQELDVLEGASAFFAAGRVRVVLVDGFAPDSGVRDFLERQGLRLLNPFSLNPLEQRRRRLLAVRD